MSDPGNGTRRILPFRPLHPSRAQHSPYRLVTPSRVARANMERRFRPGIRERTRRIPEEVWERLKPVIIELYNTMTLGAVKERMEEEHNFTAT